jgi:hypothetical protein
MQPRAGDSDSGRPRLEEWWRYERASRMIGAQGSGANGMNAGGPPRGVGIQSQAPARAFVKECRLVELHESAAGCALGHPLYRILQPRPYARCKHSPGSG